MRAVVSPWLLGVASLATFAACPCNEDVPARLVPDSAVRGLWQEVEMQFEQPYFRQPFEDDLTTVLLLAQPFADYEMLVFDDGVSRQPDKLRNVRIVSSTIIRFEIKPDEAIPTEFLEVSVSRGDPAFCAATAGAARLYLTHQ